MSPDEQQIRALIDAWGDASLAGDLDAQLAMMTEDVTFLTAGNPPMSRADFIAGFTRMMKLFRLACRSDIREVTIAGDLAITWNRLAVDITPLAGGDILHRTGDTLTIFRREPDGRWLIWRDANMMSPR